MTLRYRNRVLLTVLIRRKTRAENPWLWPTPWWSYGTDVAGVRYFTVLAFGCWLWLSMDRREVAS